MDPLVSASFIPKKPLEESRSFRGSGGTGILFLIALLFFIASIIAAGSSFLYGRYLSISLDGKKASLAKYQEAYDLSTIQTLVRYDARIHEASAILKKHLAPSALFTLLSQQTLEKVQFTDFTYAVGAADKGPTITVHGVADSFATVALQSDQLGNSKVLKDVVFFDIAIQSSTKISFSVKATIDPSFILYSNNLATEQSSTQ